MRGIAFTLLAAAFAAAAPDPAVSQCYGPECDRQRIYAPSYNNERPDFHSYPSKPYRSSPYEQAQPYRPAPYQAQPYRSVPYEQAQPYRPAPYQGQPYHPGPPQQHQPYHAMPQSQPTYQQPAYQAQPRPPVGYADVPPGMAPGAAPRGPAYHPDVRTRVTKFPKQKKPAVRPHQAVPNGRTVVRTAPSTTGSGQVTISVAEYRDLQNQARELQRLLSSRSGDPNRGSPFPDVRTPPGGNPPGQNRAF